MEPHKCIRRQKPVQEPFLPELLSAFRRSFLAVLGNKLNVGEPPSGANGKLALLQTLAQSGDNWVKLGTLVLITLSGLGNFFTTKQNGHATRHEVQTVIRQVGEIHATQGQYSQELQKIDDLERLAHQNQAAITELKANQQWVIHHWSRKTDSPEF